MYGTVLHWQLEIIMLGPEAGLVTEVKPIRFRPRLPTSDLSTK